MVEYLPVCALVLSCVCVCVCVFIQTHMLLHTCTCTHTHTVTHSIMHPPYWINGSLVVVLKRNYYIPSPSKPFSFLSVVCSHLKWCVANAIFHLTFRSSLYLQPAWFTWAKDLKGRKHLLPSCPAPSSLSLPALTFPVCCCGFWTACIWFAFSMPLPWL